MNSAWLFYLTLIVIVHRGSVADDDFRPMPIPVSDWHERRAPAPPEPVARYWEDALRHSVYLTLVRDKIDQLIAKGDVIPPDAKLDQHAPKEVDDHDLWEKIKTAPFDRADNEEPEQLGDDTIVARGRLLEQMNGLRFVEDEPTRAKCSDERCMQGVKVLWSVKRVRQRDADTSGRYHYELTFSVTSQAPKKQKKPFENPVRTFTVRETDPQKVMDPPQEHRGYEQISVHPTRAHRTIWLHKNIVPQSRKINNGLERIFSTLFDDDDEPPRIQRHRPMSYPPQYQTTQHQSNYKPGYVGSPSDQQKRLTPYPYKPHTYKYSRPLPPPPYQQPQHFIDSNTFVSGVQSDRYVPNGPIRTTRPAVLPTPLDPVQQYNNWTTEASVNSSESTTIADVSFQKPTFPKTRPVSMKINYLSDHVRPPVYNAPPGVFVTMDKKPFKPMPPLKLVHSKPLRYNRPADFRPSPQLNLHNPEHHSHPDPLAESHFRPINYNFTETTTTERIQLAETSSYSLANNTRKPMSTTKGKKPPKKHDHINKVQKSSTAVPEIITAGSSEEEDQAPQWVNVIGSFSKTTPMDTHKDHHHASEEKRETTTTTTTTTTVTTPIKKRTTTEPYVEPATTAKPKKRTRPPPTFTKPDKIKKHKRVTTTTTKAPEVKTQDLIPQASTAAAKPPATNNTIKANTTTTTTTSTTTTARPATTTKLTTKQTTKQPSTTEDSGPTSSTTQPKIKNRFRQSTLMVKGTSVKHDKWSVTPSNVEKSKPTIPTKFPPRRKGSNFQGHVTTATPEEDLNIYGVQGASKLTAQTENFEESEDQYDSLESNFNYDNPGETKDRNEYIFQSSSTHSDASNEIDEQEEAVTTEPTFTTPKNKTKCKKKLTTTPISASSEETTTEPLTTTVEPTTSETASLSSTPSIFEELFGAFTLNDGIKKAESTTPTPDQSEQESENHADFVKLDDDLQDFLDSLEKGQKAIEDRSNDDAEYEDVEDEDEADDSLAYEDVRGDRYADTADTTDDSEQRRPFSLLELMAMED